MRASRRISDETFRNAKGELLPNRAEEVDIFSRILVPTDLTNESSDLAVRLTESRGLGAEELVLLNVVEMGPQIGFATDGFERMVAWKRDAEAGLRELREQVEVAGIRCRWRLELGKPSREILRVADEERVALIAVGSHGHGLVRRMLRRSLTGEVVDGAACPVLIVPVTAGKRVETESPHRASGQLLRRMLLVTDSCDEAEAAVALVKGLPAVEVDEILVLSVSKGQRGRRDTPSERGARLGAELRYFGLTVTYEEREGKMTSAIAHILRARDVSLIVMGSGSRRRAKGPQSSIAGAVRRASNRPVLVVPAAGA